MALENQEQIAKPKGKKGKIFLTILLILAVIIVGGAFYAHSTVKKIIGEQLLANGVTHESLVFNYPTLTFSIHGIGYSMDDGTTKLDATIGSVSLVRVNPFSYFSDEKFPLIFSHLSIEDAKIQMTQANTLTTNVSFDSQTIYNWRQNIKSVVEALSYGTDSLEFLESALSFQIEKIDLINLKTKTTLNGNLDVDFDLASFATAWSGTDTSILLRNIALKANADKNVLALAPLSYSLSEFDTRNIQLPTAKQLAIMTRASMLPEDKAAQDALASLNYLPFGKEPLKVYMNETKLSMLNKEMLKIGTLATILDMNNYILAGDIDSIFFTPELLSFINPFLAQSMLDLGFENGLENEIFFDIAIPDLGNTIKIALDFTTDSFAKVRLFTELDTQYPITSFRSDNLPSLIHLFNLKYEDLGLIPRFNIMTQNKLKTSFERAQDNMLLATAVLKFVRPNLASDFEKAILEPGILEINLGKASSVKEMLQDPFNIPITTNYTSKGLDLKTEVEKIQSNK